MSLALLLLIACGTPEPPDRDGDGLTDAEELALGTSPVKPDTDGDGLSDLAERDGGTDPALADSDGDGYSDGDERAAGHDPLDADDRIYAGGWPFNPDKDALEPDEVAELGARFRRLRLLDQHGERVDLYDFAGHGVPVVVEIAGMWCAPCQEVAAMLAGQPSELTASFPHVRAGLEDGAFYWLTVLTEDEDSATPDLDDLLRWEAAWPTPYVPVLAGDDEVASYAAPALPAVWMLDEALQVTAITEADGGPVVLQALESLLGG